MTVCTVDAVADPAGPGRVPKRRGCAYSDFSTAHDVRAVVLTVKGAIRLIYAADITIHSVLARRQKMSPKLPAEGPCQGSGGSDTGVGQD